MPTAEQRRALRRILQVEAELEPIVLRALRRSARRTLRPLGLTASAQRPTPEDMRALVGFWHQEIDKLISPAMLKLFQKAAEDTMGLLPGALDLGNIGTNIRDVRAAAWFGTVKNRLVGVGENMYQDVASSLRDSYAAGEGVDKQAARIRNVMGNEATANRAARIARTEGAAIVNGADHSVALELEQAGIVNKRKWLATEDARTRPTHAAADGQLVGINEPFLVGGSRLMYPSDPAGPPEEVIQCRCTTLLEVTEEDIQAASPFPTLTQLDPSSYVDSYKHANPGTGVTYRNNCHYVVNAMEMRARGYECVAAQTYGSTGRFLTSIERDWVDADGRRAHFITANSYNSVATRSGSGWIPKPDWPPGARGFVNVEWKTGGAHIFNMYIDDEGVARFIDGQVQLKNAEKYFDRATSVKFARIDTLEPVPERVLQSVTPGSTALPKTTKNQLAAAQALRQQIEDDLAVVQRGRDGYFIQLDALSSVIARLSKAI